MMRHPNDVYPTSNKMSSAEEGYNILPDSLAPFLKLLFSTKDSIVKIASIGQAVVQEKQP